MTLEGRDIVCFSTHYWDERRFRKQEFMSRFARSNRVLYVEPSVSMVRRPEAHLREFATNRFAVSRLAAREPGIKLLKPPRGLPKPSNPRVERWNYRWYGQIVNRAVRRLGFRRPILWIYRPAYLHGLSAIDHADLVVDVVDDLAAYDNRLSDHVENSLRQLVTRSELVVVTAKTLLERYEPLAKNAVHIPNGFDSSLFSLDRQTPGEPSVLAGIPKPILGFVGTLFKFLNFELLEEVARFHHDKSVVLIGPVEAHTREWLARLCRMPNVVHLGAQPQAEIPNYVRTFDVCLNPFRRAAVSDSISPLKVYEYLAMGRPVVSTPMKSLQMEQAGSVVAFAPDTPAFCKQIDHCLESDVQRRVSERSAAVEAYSWAKLFDRLDGAVANALAY